MVSYRISEASRVLGVSDDTVRRWIESGKLTAVPGTSPREVDGESLAQYVKATNPHVSEGRASTRNLLEGLVLEVVSDKVMSQVVLQCGRYRVVSLISTEAVEELGIVPGSLASAQIKATNVSIVIPPAR
ncbi:MAG: TOBE domain-containing protein [Ancrocorticia sp.]|uniref:TOBE domain-containing protein n=1 Tax=Ancrocorticia sp. TaxID=2593684 RepID=UPI003F900514